MLLYASRRAPTAAAPALAAVPRIDSYIARPGPVRANEKARTFLLNTRTGQELQDFRNLLPFFLNALLALREHGTT